MSDRTIIVKADTGAEAGTETNPFVVHVSTDTSAGGGASSSEIATVTSTNPIPANINTVTATSPLPISIGSALSSVISGISTNSNLSVNLSTATAQVPLLININTNTAQVPLVINNATNTAQVALVINNATNTAGSPLSMNLATFTAGTPVAISGSISSVFVQQLKGTATAFTVLSATVASIAALASNANRRQATFFAESTGSIYLKWGAGASAGSYSVKLESDDYYELPQPIYTGAIEVAWSTNSGTLRITELS